MMNLGPCFVSVLQKTDWIILIIGMLQRQPLNGRFRVAIIPRKVFYGTRTGHRVAWKKAGCHASILSRTPRHFWVGRPRGRGKDSDIDILVECEPGAHIGLFQVVRLHRELSNILGRAVDLPAPDSLRKELREDTLKEAVHAAAFLPVPGLREQGHF
jgi:hypothetical protein